MTDREIIDGLINRDNTVTEQFFFVKCRPLLKSIIRFIFSYEVDYDEFVNELYRYLMENDCQRLRSFQYRSTVYQWIKVTAIRYFIRRRNAMIENLSKETLKNRDNALYVSYDDSSADLERLLAEIPNKRYTYVIEKLVVEEIPAEELAKSMGITTSNLYNIKKRAIAVLTRIAIKDIQKYGKREY